VHKRRSVEPNTPANDGTNSTDGSANRSTVLGTKCKPNNVSNRRAIRNTQHKPDLAADCVTICAANASAPV